MRTVLLLVFLLTGIHLSAQQALTKRNRFGIGVVAGTCFNSSQSTLMVLENDRSAVYGFGGTYEHQRTGLISFRSGLNFEFTNARFSDNPSDSIDLYYYERAPRSFDKSPCNYEQLQEAYVLYPATPPDFRQTLRRKYRFGYLTVPLEVVFRSKLHNFNRFYGKAGILTSFAFFSKAMEKYDYVDGNPEFRYERIIIRDVNRIRNSLVLGIGGERVYTGHSSVFIDVEFALAITNTFSQQQKNANIFLGKGYTGYYPVEDVSGSEAFGLNHLRQSQFRIRIGFLF